MPAIKSGSAKKSTAAKNLSVTFSLEKETPGTVRYKEDGDKSEHTIGTLYLKKPAAAALGNPDNLEVVITAS